MLRLFIAAALVLAAIACPAVAADPGPGETVTFSASDGTLLSGVWRGGSDRVVILSHQYDQDQTSWAPLVARLEEAGYATLTYNFRGYPPSQGQRVISELGRDLDAAVAFARSRGATHLTLIGASMGGIATVPAALTAAPDAYVTISAPTGFSGLEAPDDALAASPAAKLFINSENDDYIADTRHMAEVAAEPRTLSVYPTGLHGVLLFLTPDGERLLDEITDFVKANMPL